MMFDTALLESSGRIRTNQRWTTLLSLLLQVAALTGIVAGSLVFVDTLPASATRVEPLRVPPGREPSPPNSTPHPAQPRGSELTRTGAVVLPMSVPHGVTRIVDPPDVQPGYNGPGVPYSVGSGDGNGVPGGTGFPVIQPPAITEPKGPPQARTIKWSHLETGYVTFRVEPQYPVAAKIARVQGAVVLNATITRDGRLESLQVLGGHPLLVTAAVDALRQWRFRPYVLNGEPVEVQTQITFNFVLQQQ